MDTPELPLSSFEAGKGFLDAVKVLGLLPAACFWAYDRPLDTFVLVLITDEYDHVGPLALSRLLFKAHNADAIPNTIDPFSIRMHSPQHRIVREMDRIMPELTPTHPDEPHGSMGRAVASVGGLEIDRDWIYSVRPPTGRKPEDIRRHWRRFKQNVERVAA